MKTLCKTLQSRKQLEKLESKDVVCAEFADERNFIMEFQLDNTRQVDLVISFDTRSPHVFISDPYTK